MQTRQELILDFMKQMAGTEQTIKMAASESLANQEHYAKEIYLMAAVFADEYLDNV